MEMETFDNLSGVSFRPQESLSIGAQLHRILRAAIIRGDLVPGQAISKIEISKKFSVSRQPVREAFIKLAEERLIEVLPQRGTYVRKISVKEMLGARHVREIIEVSIAREVALTRDADLIARLRQNIAAQRAVEPGDRKSILLIDDELHKSLALFAGREYAWRVTENIKSQIDRVRFLTYDMAKPTAQIITEHEAIVDAIEAGDPDAAAAQMESHLREILTSLPMLAERYPEHFIDD